jgi:hypothetical protein
MERPEVVFFMSSASANTYTQKLNKFIDYQEQQIKDLQTKLNTYEIEKGVTMKHVQPNIPQCSRTIHFEGKDIPEDTEVYWINKEDLNIGYVQIILIEYALIETSKNTKIYLTKPEVNARLKEMVIEKAKKRKFSIEEIFDFEHWLEMGAYKNFREYAIELVEKEKNIKYLD